MNEITMLINDVNNSCSRIILHEYERTISEVVAERERERVVHEIEKEKIAAGRDAVLQDLQSVEVAFNDVHR